MRAGARAHGAVLAAGVLAAPDRAADLGHVDHRGPGGGADRERADHVASDTRVEGEAGVHASLDESVPRIGAPAAWQAGLTGK